MTENLQWKERYYNLLVLSKNRTNKLTDSEQLELLDYQVILTYQVYYNQRELYISLIEEYLSENAGTAGTDLFIYEFFTLWSRTIHDMNALEIEILETGISRLENFPIDSGSKSKEFYDSIEYIFAECDGRSDQNISDELFRFLIQDTLLEIKQDLKSINPDKLVERSYRVLVFFSLALITDGFLSG